VVIELTADRTVRLSEQHAIAFRGKLKRSEIRKALDQAEKLYDSLVAEYERQK